MIPGSTATTTKEKILYSAASLFAAKGFTETTVRELAESVGIMVGSIYHHFPSKNALLENMLDDYSSFNSDLFNYDDIFGILKDNPTTDGVLVCLQLSFPTSRMVYYKNALCVMLQEQLRNPIVRDFMSDQYILRAEKNIEMIINVLKELGVIHQDADPDYWMKASSSFFYAFAARMMLGIGDNSPDFVGRGMAEMLRSTFELMFEKHSAGR